MAHRIDKTWIVEVSISVTTQQRNRIPASLSLPSQYCVNLLFTRSRLPCSLLSFFNSTNSKPLKLGLRLFFFCFFGFFNDCREFVSEKKNEKSFVF